MTQLIHTCDVMHFDSFICVPHWAPFVRNQTNRAQCGTHMTRLIHVCAALGPICLISNEWYPVRHTYDTTHSYVCHNGSHLSDFKRVGPSAAHVDTHLPTNPPSPVPLYHSRRTRPFSLSLGLYSVSLLSPHPYPTPSTLVCA